VINGRRTRSSGGGKGRDIGHGIPDSALGPQRQARRRCPEITMTRRARINTAVPDSGIGMPGQFVAAVLELADGASGRRSRVRVPLEVIELLATKGRTWREPGTSAQSAAGRLPPVTASVPARQRQAVTALS
jgi:hypothetical protein